MWCCKKSELKYQDFEEEKPPEYIKPFHETFRIVTFGMSAGLLYPNPATDKFRFRVMMTIYVSVLPVCVIILMDIYDSWKKKDIQNIIRHGTITIPFFLVLTKMFIMYIHRVPAKKIIDEMNRDHEALNYLPESYRPLIEDHFKKAKFGEKYWLTIVIHCVGIFPFMSSVMNFYEYCFKAEPQKHMIHDLNLPFTEPEIRFDSPYFELMYLYMLYCCAIYFMNFVGYDGFFGLAVRHACLNMKIYCKGLEDAMKLQDKDDIMKKVSEVVKAQCKLFELVKTIQEAFNFWLGMIFVGTVIHVCNCMYQIMEGIGMDLKYLIFIAGSVVHIYLPCNYASKLKSMASDTSIHIYCCGWEMVNDQRVRKMIIYMIARAQLPLVITAFNIMTFDMELFVSILRTSYSMFTLLRPTE